MRPAPVTSAWRDVPDPNRSSTSLSSLTKGVTWLPAPPHPFSSKQKAPALVYSLRCPVMQANTTASGVQLLPRYAEMRLYLSLIHYASVPKPHLY